VRFAGDRGQADKTVVGLNSPTSFVLGDVNGPETKVFVLGKEVPDFHVVNDEDLFSTGLAAIQELSERNDALQAQAQQTTILILTLTNDFDSLKAQVRAILETRQKK
jgi:hypothetical protein